MGQGRVLIATFAACHAGVTFDVGGTGSVLAVVPLLRILWYFQKVNKQWEAKVEAAKP